MSKRPYVLAIALTCLAVRWLSAQSVNHPEDRAIANRTPLQKNTYNPLPLGAIEPRGWLRRQLELQAGGLTGHLGEFWKDVSDNSGWLGGSGESWERGPYYLDGLLPLAYQLGNRELIEKARHWVEWTITNQRADGQIGPKSNDDWWPRMVMLKVLTQYHEVSGDSRVIPLMTKYFHYELANLPQRPLRDWGKYRWHDNAYTAIWLYNRTGDRKLLDLTRLLHKQGYDWQAQFADFQYKDKLTREVLNDHPNGKPSERAMQTHGVNNAMALKASPLWFLVSGSSKDRAALAQQLSQLDKYHGLPNGMFSGDEHLAGIDPSQGIELCAVVEAMFSLEQAFSIEGNPLLADRLERIAYNALPATLSNDMWSHQYDQQPNQIACTRARRQWSTNGDDSNVFGLEPNFGCCTANLHQGWPKFVSSLWMATNDGGLIAAAYAPSQVKTVLGKSTVKIEEETDYPFKPAVRFTIHVSKPQPFPLVLRIPSWATGGSVSVNGQSTKLEASGCSLPDGRVGSARTCESGRAFHRMTRTWKDGDKVEVTFDAPPRTTHWFHDSVTFERGPLVFALPLDAEWSKLKHYAQNSYDWQLTPTKDWNYAAETCMPDLKEASTGDIPFDIRNPRIVLEINGRLLPDWDVREHSAGPLPVSPVRSNSPAQKLMLVPYGSAKLRITSFPSLAGNQSCTSSALRSSR